MPSLSSMQFQLICLYDKGRPLTKEQLAEAPRYAGNFVIEDWPMGGQYTGSSFGRHIRQARLKREKVDGGSDIIPPLFDQVCVKVDDHRMIFSGYVISTEDGQPVHNAQYWVIKPVNQEDEE